MAIQRVTSAPGGRRLARCPGCAAEIVVDDETRGGVGTPVRTLLRCSCGRRFSVLLERRAAVRREVSIPGVASLAQGGRGRPITILNLSRTGLLLADDGANGSTVGETLWVRFALDPASGPWYHLRCQVVRLEPRGLAAEFADLGGREAAAYDLALALYDPPPSES